MAPEFEWNGKAAAATAAGSGGSTDERNVEFEDDRRVNEKSVTDWRQRTFTVAACTAKQGCVDVEDSDVETTFACVRKSWRALQRRVCSTS